MSWVGVGEKDNPMKDKMGRYRTQSLFVEYRHGSGEPIFTLKPYDKEVNGVKYESLMQIYLSYGDVTEYEFAIAVFGSWAHWQKICRNGVISPFIELWREELELKIRAEAIRTVRAISTDPKNKGGLGAAKWLADRGWDKKPGRPSKVAVKRELKIAANLTEELDDDYARIVAAPKSVN